LDDRVFDALGDSTRRQVLEVLAAGELPVGAIVATLQADLVISQPAVSQHLKVLREAGLVTAHADGRQRVYAIDRAGLATAQAGIERLGDPLAAFAQPLDALETEVRRGKRTRGRRRRAA
jgi:DNA-binding transcriptional ArsR family regulator